MFLPLQPRFVSSSSVTLILTVFSFISLILHFAHATDADSIAHDDHNHPRTRDLHDRSGVSGTLELMLEEGSRSYEPTFAGLERSILGRNPGIVPLKIDTSTTAYIDPGVTHTWKVQSAPTARNLANAYGEKNNGDSHELLKRQDGRWMSLTLSLSICDISNPGNDRPQMSLGLPSPDALGNITTISGFGSTYLNVTNDVIFEVYVNTSHSPDFKGTYSYELTASGIPNVNLTFLDSDNNSTLLATNWSSRSHDGPHSIIVYPNNSSIQDISNSSCALMKLTRIKEANVTPWKTNLTGGIKQLFHINGLNPGTSYWAIMNDSSQGVAGSGFEVSRPVKFTTKSDGNCAVIYNLSFCTDTAYAVPYNPYSNLSLSALRYFYDIQAELRYENFTFSREQIPCNTSSSAKYSLARTCDDCDNAYKSWLCAVTIPRCEDFSAEHDWLQNRSVSQPFWNNTNTSGIENSNKTSQVTNSSRQPMIDQMIKPGPWKEVLPCEDLCYRLVQSCPAALGFACPTGKLLRWSYGKAQHGTDITCNDPTSEWKQSAASRGVSTNILGSLVAFGLIFVLQLGGHY